MTVKAVGRVVWARMTTPPSFMVDESAEPVQRVESAQERAQRRADAAGRTWLRYGATAVGIVVLAHVIALLLPRPGRYILDLLVALLALAALVWVGRLIGRSSRAQYPFRTALIWTAAAALACGALFGDLTQSWSLASWALMNVGVTIGLSGFWLLVIGRRLGELRRLGVRDRMPADPADYP